MSKLGKVPAVRRLGCIGKRYFRKCGGVSRYESTWAKKCDGSVNAVYSSGALALVLFRSAFDASSSNIIISSTQKTARARAIAPTRNVFCSCDFAL